MWIFVGIFLGFSLFLYLKCGKIKARDKNKSHPGLQVSVKTAIKIYRGKPIDDIVHFGHFNSMLIY